MKSINQQKRHRKKQLTAQYMVAVALIFLLSLSSLLVLRYTMQQQEGYASVINLSGKQRMLSQQISLLAYEIATVPEGVTTEKLVKQIHFTISQMEQAHQSLISGKAEDGTGVEQTAALARIYFHSPLELDSSVTEYLAGMRTVIATPAAERNHGELHALSTIARGELLNALDKAVQQYELESTDYSATIKNNALTVFLLMVLLLAVIVVFGFRPMTNMVVDNEGMLHTILDSIPIMIDIIDKDGTILYQSSFFLDLLGESTIGQKCHEVYKTDQSRCKSCPVEQTELDYDIKTTTDFDRLGPGTVVQVTHLPILFKGEEATLRTLIDITEQQITEAFLIKAREEADHASELKSLFLANMSHEIRTPMNAIIGFSTLALETEMNEQQQDYLKKISRSSHLLLKIINDILNFSKIEADQVTLEKKEFCLDEVIKDILNLFDTEAQEKNISLVIHQQSEIPLFLVGDALRLQQILMNLIGNSLKFTAQGNITLQVELESLSEQWAKVQFSVADTGIGIASKKLATLFDSFSQADSSTTREYGGTGLGLAISRQLVELSGGELTVSSKEGEGTVFSFTVEFELPVAEEKKQLVFAEDRDVSCKVAAIARIRGAHILLVEDNLINQQLAEAILATAGITLDIVGNGQRALEKYFATAAEYDAILMDIQMPVMSGVTCTRELRAREQNSRSKSPGRIPVIAMTANAIQGDRKRYLQAGMDDYVAKPINRTELFCVLARWIPENGAERRVTQDLSEKRHGKERRQMRTSERGRRKRPNDRRQSNEEYTLPEYLAGVNLAQGLARVEGNVGLYLRLLQVFVTDYAAIDDEIRKALENKDQESAERLVHTVKGVAGSLGAQDLAAAALALEQSIKTAGQGNGQMTQFTIALQQVLSSLAILPAIQQDSETTAEKSPPLNDERLAILLTELRTMLSGKNFQANSKWQELKPLLQTVPNEQRLQLDSAINSFEFEQALDIVMEIRSRLEFSTKSKGTE